MLTGFKVSFKKAELEYANSMWHTIKVAKVIIIALYISTLITTAYDLLEQHLSIFSNMQKVEALDNIPISGNHFLIIVM